jgi:hypothetical protein
MMETAKEALVGFLDRCIQLSVHVLELYKLFHCAELSGNTLNLGLVNILIIIK